MADRFTAMPTLIIGLGGTGLKVATFVKKSLMETNHNELPNRTAVLVLDTEQEVKFKAGGWGQKRDEQHATGPVSIEGGEYVPLVGNVRPQAEEIKKEQKEARAYPEARRNQSRRHINPWFQAEFYLDKAVVKDNVWNLNEGAGRYRQFGRLGLFNNIRTVTTMISGSLQALKGMGADRVYVHLAGSLAGGTGAALFIDVAHLVRQLAHKAVGFSQTPVIFGHFVLPEAFRGTSEVQIANPGVKADFDARAYAALRELSRLQGQTIKTTGGYPLVYNPGSTAEMNARLEDTPYTAVYLYDGQRLNNPLNTLQIEDGLAPAMADAIVAYVDDLSGSTFCSHVVNYDSFKTALNIPTGAVTYGSVGTYTIELPIYHLTESWAHDLAKEVLDTLLKPTDFDDRKVPTVLAFDHPGGIKRSPKEDAYEWLKREPSSLVGQLAEWGRAASQTSNIFQQKVDESLNFGASGWQQKLAPTDLAWRSFVAEAEAELNGSLKDRASAKYYVDHQQSGNTDEQRAENLISEIDIKLKQMLGSSRDGWLREGGDFRRALVRLVHHHIANFDDLLMKLLKRTLNGSEGETIYQSKQGKLGYAKAFVQDLDQTLQSCAKVLATAAEQSKNKRRPLYNTLESQLKESASRMRSSKGFRGSNLKEYRDKADELAQFQKADIAREVVGDLVKRLQETVSQVKDELELWERILGLAKASEGGAYGLVVEGRTEIAVDRERSKSAARWVIDDDEADDTYLSDRHQEYSDGALEQVLKLVTWEVGRAGPDLKSPIRVNFKLDQKQWDRVAGGAGQRRRGLDNLTQLLAKCRAPFEKAWDNMSVTAYLEHNYKSRVDELAAKVREHSGYMLATTDDIKDPPMRSTYMRVYKDGLDVSHENFLRRLKIEVAVAFKESVNAERQSKASDSGEPSRDRFKLTFVMFGDLLQPKEIAGYQTVQSNYHLISGNGEGWRTLHILPAETNALQIECDLSSGHDDAQQRRELSEEVVVTLEDIDRFRLAMRCLAYGETDYVWGPDWGLSGRRGLLLHKHTPRENNLHGLSYWRLTLIPQGERRSDGRVYGDRGRLAEPRHYQLSEWADEPDLLQAFVQLVCVGRDLKTMAELDWSAVEETVRYMIGQHCQQWLNKEAGWQPKARTAADPQLLDEAQDKVAQMIRLQALIEEANQTLNKYRWAWVLGGKTPGSLAPDKVHHIRRFIDLWTAIYAEAQEEFGNLNRRFNALADWRGEIPTEKLSMNTDVARGEVVAGEAPAPTPIPQEDDSWTCPNGHVNMPDKKFCTQCRAPRPESTPPITLPPIGLPVPPKSPVEEVICVQGHPMPLIAKFCPECGQPPRPVSIPEKIVCTNGHEMSPGAKFCPECGQPPRPVSIPGKIVCTNGHEMPPGAKFCPECGQPPRPIMALAKMVCVNGHEMSPGAKFCAECGQPAR